MPHRDPRVAQIAQAIGEREVAAPTNVTTTPAPEPEVVVSGKLEPGAYRQPDGSIIRVTPEGLIETVDQLDAAPILSMITQVQNDFQVHQAAMVEMITQISKAINAPKEVVRGSDGLITGIKPKTGV